MCVSKNGTYVPVKIKRMKKTKVKSKTGNRGFKKCKACSGTGKKKSKQDVEMNCRKCKGRGVKK